MCCWRPKAASGPQDWEGWRVQALNPGLLAARGRWSGQEEDGDGHRGKLRRGLLSQRRGRALSGCRPPLLPGLVAASNALSFSRSVLSAVCCLSRLVTLVPC